MSYSVSCPWTWSPCQRYRRCWGFARWICWLCETSARKRSHMFGRKCSCISQTLAWNWCGRFVTALQLCRSMNGIPVLIAEWQGFFSAKDLWWTDGAHSSMHKAENCWRNTGGSWLRVESRICPSSGSKCSPQSLGWKQYEVQHGATKMALFSSADIPQMTSFHSFPRSLDVLFLFFCWLYTPCALMSSTMVPRSSIWISSITSLVFTSLCAQLIVAGHLRSVFSLQLATK